MNSIRINMILVLLLFILLVYFMIRITQYDTQIVDKEKKETIPLFIEDEPASLKQQSYVKGLEHMILARCIFAEAAGEGKLGMIAVGCVIRNRVKSTRPEFGNRDYISVILKKWQFSCVNGQGSTLWNKSRTPDKLNTQNKNSFLLAISIASDIIEEEQDDITNGAVFYMTHKAATLSGWLKDERIVKLKSIGHHVFFKYK